MANQITFQPASPKPSFFLRDAVSDNSIDCKMQLTFRDQHLDVYVDYHTNGFGRTMRHVAVCRQKAGLVGWDAPAEHG